MLKQLIVKAGGVAAVRVIGLGLSLVSSIAIARLLGAEVLGAYAYCFALLSLAAVPISQGWGIVVLRHISDQGKLDQQWHSMIRDGVLISLALSVVAFLVYLMAIENFDSNLAVLLRSTGPVPAILLALGLLFTQLSSVQMATLRGLDRPVLAQTPEMITRQALFLAVLLFCWYFQPSTGHAEALNIALTALVVGSFGAYIFGNHVIRRVASPHKPERLDFSRRKAWMESACILSASAFLIQLNGYIDLLILGQYRDAQDVGLYRAALQIAAIANFGYIAFNFLALQQFSRFSVVRDQEGLSKAAHWLARLAFLSALPIPIGLCFYGDVGFVFLFGPEFAASALPAVFVSVGFTYSAAVGMSNALLVMRKREKYVMLATCLALVCNIVLCVWLIPKKGTLGAGLANMCSLVVWNSTIWILARVETGVDTSLLGLSNRRV